MNVLIFFGTTILLAFIVISIVNYYNNKNISNSRPVIPIHIEPVKLISNPEPLIPLKNDQNNLGFNKWKEDTIETLDDTLSLSDLIIIKDLKKIYYAELLNCFEWKYKRLIILLRDKFKCNECNEISNYNHVHHNYYLQDRLPWDIENEALETLCSKCHKARHAKKGITVYRVINGIKTQVSNEKPFCSRCGGIGYILKYSHVQSGICFKCMGNTINPSIYFTTVNSIYKNLNNYNDSGKRDDYKGYIHCITYNEFLLNVPDANDYIRANNVVTHSIEDYDDLPF